MSEATQSPQPQMPQSSAPESFALSRRGLPLPTCNATPPRAPWLPAPVVSRAQPVAQRAPIFPPAESAVEAPADDAWLSVPSTSTAQPTQEEPWWMEAAEWVPVNEARDVSPAAPTTVAPHDLAPTAPAAVNTITTAPITEVHHHHHASPARPAVASVAVPADVVMPTLSAAISKYDAPAQQPLSPKPSTAHQAQQISATTEPTSKESLVVIERLGPIPRMAEKNGAAQATPASTRHASPPLLQESMQAREPRAKPAQTQADTPPDTPPQRPTFTMGLPPQSVPAAIEPRRSVASETSFFADRAASPELYEPMPQPVAHASRMPPVLPRVPSQRASKTVHIEHLAVTVQAPATSVAAPSATAPQLPPSTPTTPASSARAYRSAWSTYFARRD